MVWSQYLILNLNNSLGYISDLIFQFFLPIPSLVLFVQHIYWGCQMTGSSDCSVAGGAVYVVTGNAVHYGAAVVEHFTTQGTECLVAWAVACFVGAFLDALSDCCHPNLLCAPLHFCKWGSVVPMNNLLLPA